MPPLVNAPPAGGIADEPGHPAQRLPLDEIGGPGVAARLTSYAVPARRPARRPPAREPMNANSAAATGRGSRRAPARRRRGRSGRRRRSGNPPRGARELVVEQRLAVAGGRTRPRPRRCGRRPGAARRCAARRAAIQARPHPSAGCVLHEGDALSMVGRRADLRHGRERSGARAHAQPHLRGPAGRRVGRARGGHAAPVARLTDEPASTAAPGPPWATVAVLSLRPLPCHVLFARPPATKSPRRRPADRDRPRDLIAGAEAAYIAIVATMLDRTGSAAWVSAALLAWIGIGALVAPIAGSLGDRYDRRRVMIISDLAGAATFVAIAFVHDPAALLALTVVAAIAEAPFNPAATAAIPNLTPDDDLGWANGLISAGRTFGGLVGPGRRRSLGTVGAGGRSASTRSFLLWARMMPPAAASPSTRRRPPAWRASDSRRRRSCARWVPGGLFLWDRLMLVWQSCRWQAAQVRAPWLRRDGVRLGAGLLRSCAKPSWRATVVAG